MRVLDLAPGTIIELHGLRALFICHTRHPQYEGLRLVIWWLIDEKEFSFDALSIIQDVGEVAEFRPQMLIDELNKLQ